MPCLLFSQDKSVWKSFWNSDTTLRGFKDAAGKVMIAPKFAPITSANKFINIIAAVEKKGDKWLSYYLTKSGRKVGQDQLYVFDITPDCECEGYIRFRDAVTHKVGMFNGKGDIAIPAGYNNLTPVANGLIVALKGGTFDASKIDEHNQYPWVGGKEVLIDKRNKLLINDFKYDADINFYSLKVLKQPDNDPVRDNFKTLTGEYYSFINYDKEFKAWLKTSLLYDLTPERLLKAAYTNVMVNISADDKEWNLDKARFVDEWFSIIRPKLLELNKPGVEYHVFTEGLNPFIYDYTSAAYEKYFDNCGSALYNKYPVKQVVITRHVNGEIKQDRFDFLRTDSGYKLISVSL